MVKAERDRIKDTVQLDTSANELLRVDITEIKVSLYKAHHISIALHEGLETDSPNPCEFTNVSGTESNTQGKLS